jgi:hypothetical protein
MFLQNVSVMKNEWKLFHKKLSDKKEMKLYLELMFETLTRKLRSEYKCVFFFVRLATCLKFYVGIPDLQIQICQTKSQIKQSW